jgi:transposase InsO family protein
MPWKEQQAVDQRMAFVMAYMQHRVTMAELCREYGVSRKTGYKWTQRFIDGGTPNLLNRATIPHLVAHAVTPEVESVIVQLRRRYPTWGPKKLDAYLKRESPNIVRPSRGTIANILKRNELVKERRPRRRTPQSSFPLALASEPNSIWCADFKGKFRVARRYCHPLTISDALSRYVLRSEPLERELTEASRLVFESAFREYGLPWRMRTDNGAPFASTAIGGLSRLSVWWIKLGILPERIDAGHPEQNGRHERMHRTMKAEVASPPAQEWEEQRQMLMQWRQQFNEVRPHEALDMQTPASLYYPSTRQYPEELGDPEYPEHFELRRVKHTGTISMRDQQVVLSNVLYRECVGLEPIDDGLWHLWYGPVFLGRLQELGRKKYQLEKSQPVRSKK